MLTPVHLTRSLCVGVIFRLILDLLLNRSPQSARNVKKQLGQINSVTSSICFCLRHIKCAKLKSIISDWTCASSLASVLPVYGSSIEDAFNDLADVYESTAEQPSQESIRILEEKAAHLRIMHLNTQCMFSMFNEFLITITWDGLLIITGDVNVIMLQPAKSLTKQYLYCLVYHRNRYWDLLFSTYMFLIFKSTSSVFAISRQYRNNPRIE